MRVNERTRSRGSTGLPVLVVNPGLVSAHRAADVPDVQLILDVPLERRCDGPSPPRSSAISTRAPLRRRTVEAHPTDRSHAQAGIVSGLWRYPVKSMAGEALASADLSWAGLAGDRGGRSCARTPRAAGSRGTRFAS